VCTGFAPHGAPVYLRRPDENRYDMGFSPRSSTARRLPGSTEASQQRWWSLPPPQSLGTPQGRSETKRREKLLVALSRDDGATWRPVARLDAEVPASLRAYMMFHYPTMLQRGDTLFVAYSR
jgi:hypothetical protein